MELIGLFFKIHINTNTMKQNLLLIALLVIMKMFTFAYDPSAVNMAHCEATYMKYTDSIDAGQIMTKRGATNAIATLVKYADTTDMMAGYMRTMGLQGVTNIGATTTNNITFDGASTDAVVGPTGFALTSGVSNPSWSIMRSGSQTFRFRFPVATNTSVATFDINNLSVSRAYEMPNAPGVFALSVNGQGSSTAGDVTLTTSNITEGSNLYYTDTRARGAITFTTTGTSGAATYSSSTGALNVPNYTPAAISVNNAPGLTLVTVAAAANGGQISGTRNALVSYSVTITCAVQIGVIANVEGYVALEIAPTNSTTASDWKEISRVSASQNISLALALASTQKSGGPVSGIVPAGWYRRIRSINVSGTPTYVLNGQQEIML